MFLKNFLILHSKNQKRAPLFERRPLFFEHEALRYFAPIYAPGKRLKLR